MAPRMSASAPVDEAELFADRPESSAGFNDGVDNRAHRTALSFEVIPPRHDADEAKIDHLLTTLQSYKPDYISVTSSKRSGWLDGTAKFIERISTTTDMRPVAHLACTAGTRDQLVSWIDTFVDAGVRGLLALRGDLPEGEDRLPDNHLQHADALVRLIRQMEQEQAARFAAGRLAVGVACYPNGHFEAENSDEDFDVLLSKQRAGADLAITQLFFDADDYLRFADQARLAGVKLPLIPGIMPMTSVARVKRMGQLSGLTVPQGVLDKLSAAKDAEEEHAIGMQLTADLARTILAGGAGSLHIYTHNNAAVTEELLAAIGIAPRV